MEKFRPCGDCSVCCQGFLSGSSHGNRFGNSRVCVFLVNKECSIYQDRPTSCNNYQCAWSQSLFPEWMKPNQVGVLVSVEFDHKTSRQFLRVVETQPVVNYDVYKEIDQFCQQNNTYYVKVIYESNCHNT